MRKPMHLWMGLAVLLGLAAVLTAQQTATPASPQHHASSKKVFKGTVQSVTLADPAKGVKSEIAAADAQNKTMVFLVKPTTTLYDASGNAMTLDKIVKGNTAKIRYTTTAEGVHEASSIRLTK
jgi:hypothetical protein